ncbi:MAG: serine/threonine-protein kinase [Polyangiaceae bacterium]
MEDKAQPQRESSPSDPVSGSQPRAVKKPAGVPLVTPFAEGDVIADKYEVIKIIGSGGMGYVVSATHIELGHQVALKFLRTELLVHRDLVARFAREARTAVMIKSEHVARVFDVGTLPEAGPYIAMELLEGQDLGRVVSERGALPMEASVDYILQACEALATAHALGIVHRDIKPENLFLSRSVPGVDVIKVLDFGISKLDVKTVTPETPQRSRRPTVRSTSAVGSPTYMSPEQIRAVDNVDARADVWALGCVLYELLTGAPAFDAPSLTELAAKILERPPAPLRELNSELPAELEAVLDHCLDKDPAKRFQNVGELAAALCPFAAPRSRIVAERCRYVLDPSTKIDDFDETTGPISWNGVSMGVDSMSPSRAPDPPTAIGRVSMVARRVAREPKKFAPIAAAVVLFGIFGVYRAVSSNAPEPTLASQTFLTAPAAAPSAGEILNLEAPPAAAENATAPGANAAATTHEATTASRETRPAPRVAPRRATPPPLRPRTPAPASSSASAEPDVGF